MPCVAPSYSYSGCLFYQLLHDSLIVTLSEFIVTLSEIIVTLSEIIVTLSEILDFFDVPYIIIVNQ